MAFRPSLLAAALVLPSLLAACGGDDEGNVVPEGTHYHYVANKVFVPTTNTQAREYGLDLNKDGTVDNQLGMVLSTLGSMGFDIQTTIDTAVAEGSIILLADFQTKDFTNTTAAGIQVFLGDKATATPMPAAARRTWSAAITSMAAACSRSRRARPPTRRSAARSSTARSMAAPAT